MLNLKSENPVLSKNEIVNYYHQNCKSKTEFKIGLEYEQLSLNADSRRNAPYEDLEKIIAHFASIYEWGILKDGNTTIGAIKGKSSVSLEPGGQFEISLEPKTSVAEIEREMLEILALLNKIAKIYNVKFVQIGLTPYSTYQNIDIMPKSRYLIMADYLPKRGAFSPVMMRETAGVQVNFDYENESDAMQKLRVSAKISPFMTGFFANSPIRAGKTTPYKSFRALAWKYTDSKRCALFYKNLLKNRSSLGFEDYVDEILNVPMLFFEREGKKIEINGEINFKDFMKYGYEGYSAALEDYILHSSLTFPDVRLKNCLEIRNHDAQKLPLTLAICAFYKGILHSKFALNEVDELLNFDGEKLDNMGFLAAKHGLDFTIEGCHSPKKITQKLFEISHKNLGEEKNYLELPLDMLKRDKLVIDEFNLEEFWK